MLRKQWQDYALKAKQIAKHIVTGLEQNKKGVRLVHIVYGLDMYATDALNLKYSKQRSKSSVHTYQGGRQEISTQHADGSEGLFKSNGEFHPTNNPMDTEVKEYMNNNLDENKQYKANTNMKRVVKLNENIIRNVVRQIINETAANQEKERMLADLFNYLSKEPTDDIYDGGMHGKHYINTSYKAYNYFEPKGIVHDVWAVHYTTADAFENIQKRGFRKGVPDMDYLAYASHYHDNNPSFKSGWNFALPLDNKYLGEDLGYGDCAFLIKTDGVRAYHKGDGDDEIIFKDCMVTQRIPFVYDEDYDCWILFDYGYNFINGKLPKGAYYDEDLERVVFEDVYSLIKFAISTNKKP